MRRAPPSTTRKTHADGLCAEKPFFATRCAWCCVNEAHHNYVSFFACTRTVFVATFTPIRSRTVQLIRFFNQTLSPRMPKVSKRRRQASSAVNTRHSIEPPTVDAATPRHGTCRTSTPLDGAVNNADEADVDTGKPQYLPDSPTIESVVEDSAET